MKFRLPFQIYRTGVISRSSSPGKILNKFCKDNEVKVRKKTSKINSSYRALISNYIYRFTHLPLKITMSKLRNRTKFKSSTKSHKSKIRNEFVFLQEVSKDNSTYKKAKNDNVTNEASECCMNSTKCANFMCAKSTAKILLQQRDLLCNKSSKKSVTTNPEEVKPKEDKIKNGVTKSINVQIKDNKGMNNATPPPLKKIDKPVDIPIKEKHKPNEYKYKFNKSEAVVSDSELRRLKRLLQSSEKNRNYKIEEAPQAPIRMDNVMGAPHFPKKLPELPVQNMPKMKQVRLKEGPSLVAPKRKYDASEMTRNYKAVDDVCHSPPRMDNLVGCKAEPKGKSFEIKGFHRNYTKQQIPNKSSRETEVKKDAIKNAKYYVNQRDHKLPKNNNVTEMVNDEKDAFLLKLYQAVNDLVPKTERSTKSLQQLKTSNVNVSERIKKFEELIGNNSDQYRNKSERLKSKLLEENLLSQVKQTEKKDHGLLSPKLSPFAIAEIRRKYYPPDTFEKDKSKATIPINTQMAFAVPLIEKNDIGAETKINHFYSRPKEQYKNLDENIYSKMKETLTCNNHVEKRKDMLTIDVNNSISDSLEASTINIITPKVIIPPPRKAATVPENKRNYSSTAINEYKEALNVCTDLLNSPNINMIYSNLTATPNQCYNVTPMERKFSANIKRSGEINSDVSRAKKRTRIEYNNVPQDLETLKLDRKFSTDVLTRNIGGINSNTKELNGCTISNSNSNMQHTSQRNLNEHHCTIEVSSTLDNQDNTVSLTDGSDKLTRKLCYQFYHEKCTISKNVNNYEMAAINLPKNPLKTQSATTIEINTDDLIIDDTYNNMLNAKTTLLNNYIKWKMQLQKFGTPQKKCTEPSKCSLNITNGIDKQNKYRIKKYKITRRKQKIPNNNIPEQNDSINNTVNLIKTQVAQNCVLFDKISDSLLKKTDISNNCNPTNNELQQKKEKMEYLQNNKKSKPSLVPMLDSPPKKKNASVPEMKRPTTVLETKRSPVLETRKATTLPRTNTVTLIPETKNFIPIAEEKNLDTVKKSKSAVEHMEVDVPLLKPIKSVYPSTMDDDISNKRKTCFKKSSFKLKGPKVPIKEASRLELMQNTNKNHFLQHVLKIKPPAIPATMKAKKFLAKFEAGPHLVGNSLLKKIDK